MCVVSVLILLVGIYTKEGTAVTKAPLRETLAAGLIKVSGWDLVSPLVDPFTGSGTIPIEATTLALGLAPGRNRKFSFLNWPAFNMDLWKNVQKQQLRQPVSCDPTIYGSDRDQGAIEVAMANASRACVLEKIHFSCSSFSGVELPSGISKGWIVSNLPYGVRTITKDPRNLYAQMGKVFKQKFAGWNVALMARTKDLPCLFQHINIPFLDVSTCKEIDNGGIKVTLLLAKIPHHT
eukprot:TRINITY_DN1250_c0_g2_i10.p1 TRINITY_DN1250_c0_g2~~TRINITY_DN1250_c0_g2_i10.p1  ORF type:complete len:236 (+),score=51.94 TRINITY_DN1250_c0_g2_i10:26-733(+)